MIDPAFDAPGRFWRGNLHTHSDRSDGILPPEEVCRRYRAEGYDFIALTDHFIGAYGYPITDTLPFRDDGFTTLLGAELHSGAMENGEIWHVLAVGLPPDFARPDAPDFRAHPGQETGAAIARRARDAGAFVAIAHPQWSGMTLADAMSLDAAHAVEIYNHGCQVGAIRSDGFHVADAMASAGRRPTCIATDDAHFTEPDHFGGWVMVRAEVNEPVALLDALKAGRHYSTQGPELRAVRWRDDAVEVECSAVAAIVAQGRGSAAIARHGASITQATVPLGRVAESDWRRVTVVDAAGRCAWSNPVWRD